MNEVNGYLISTSTTLSFDDAHGMCDIFRCFFGDTLVKGLSVLCHFQKVESFGYEKETRDGEDFHKAACLYNDQADPLISMQRKLESTL